MSGSGWDAVAERFEAAPMPDVLVLCYHAVSLSWPAALSVTPEALDAQLGTLAQRGYRGMRFTDAVLEPVDGHVVAVTFDDNYRSVLELAKPILAPRVPGHALRPDRLRPTRTADALARHRQLAGDPPRAGDGEPRVGRAARAGRCRVGDRLAHLLASAPPGDRRRGPRARAARLEGAHRAELGCACPSLAYPYGAVDARSSRPPRGEPGTRPAPRCPSASTGPTRSRGRGSASTRSTSCGASGSRSRRRCGSSANESATRRLAASSV